MSKPAEVAVSTLKLDLHNYRTLPQKNEKDAIRAMITIKSERFWGILESILESGYQNIENIIVQKNNKDQLIVKEGNRRIGALKLALGMLNIEEFDIPKQYISKITSLPKSWKEENSKVVALIFDQSENEKVENIVSLTHGKGDKASRDPWTSVARARHNRDANKQEEPALDLLEKYLNIAKEISPLKKELWAGDYPITVLHELMRKLTPILKFEKISDFSKTYPIKPIPKNFGELISDIGENILGFENIRDEEGLNLILNRLGIPIPEKKEDGKKDKKGSSGTTGAGDKATKKAALKKPIAISSTDPRYITQTLKKFIVRGENREKVVALRDEAIRLKTIEKYPYSFCFLLRSMFEISAKAYCKDNSIDVTYVKDGKKLDKKLIDVLKGCRKHLIDNISDPKEAKMMQQALHGPITELSKSDGLLSVTSLNQLVHNPKFSTSGSNIASIFGNIFPLLEFINS